MILPKMSYAFDFVLRPGVERNVLYVIYHIAYVTIYYIIIYGCNNIRIVMKRKYILYSKRTTTAPEDELLRVVTFH